MARIRTVKPGFFTDEKLAGCSPHARLLAIGLLQLADVEGRILDVPMQIHAHCFPWEAMVKVSALLGELEVIGYVIRYENGGKRYLCVPGFKTHQRLSGKEASTPSVFPPPPDNSTKKQEVTEGENGTASRGSDGENPSASPGSAGKRKEEGERGRGNKPLSGKPDGREVLQYLNAKSEKRFQEVPGNLRLIEGLFGQGFTAEQMCRVVDRMVAKWSGTERAEYLRPKTLFDEVNFAQYVAELGLPAVGPGGQVLPDPARKEKASDQQERMRLLSLERSQKQLLRPQVVGGSDG